MFAVWESYASSPNKPRRVNSYTCLFIFSLSFPTMLWVCWGPESCSSSSANLARSSAFLETCETEMDRQRVFHNLRTVDLHHVHANNTKHRHTHTHTVWMGTDRVRSIGGREGDFPPSGLLIIDYCFFIAVSYIEAHSVKVSEVLACL